MNLEQINYKKNCQSIYILKTSINSKNTILHQVWYKKLRSKSGKHQTKADFEYKLCIDNENMKSATVILKNCSKSMHKNYNKVHQTMLSKDNIEKIAQENQSFRKSL